MLDMSNDLSDAMTFAALVKIGGKTSQGVWKYFHGSLVHDAAVEKFKVIGSGD